MPLNSTATRYVICPGSVRSRSDDQRHYISAGQLAFLYGVRLQDCELYEPQTWWGPHHYRMAQERLKGLTPLAPRADGNYTLPAAAPTPRETQ